MPQSAQPAKGTQTGQSVGAFDTPQPSKQTIAASLASGKPIPESTSHTAVLDTGSGKQQPTDTKVDVPPDTWTKPKVVDGAPGLANKKGQQTAIATFVADGDTATMKLGDNSSVVCRLDGIDAPETAKPAHGKPGQPYGDKAKTRLQELIENKEVMVSISYPKKGENYDRALCQIEFKGANVNKTMVAEGLAWVYSRYAPNKEMAGLESNAREKKLGLWADIDPVKPSIFRKSLEK